MTEQDKKDAGGGLLRSTAVVGAMTLLSRILGFVRDVVFARLFGADAAMDAFLVAFKIPNFLRRLFAEGAFSQAFVPVFSERRGQRDAGEVKALADAVAGSFGLVLLAITALGVLAAPLLILLFAPGFAGDPQQYRQAVDMLRITFPYLMLISLTAFAGGILQSYGRFAVPAFTPVLLNLSFLGCALWLAPHFAVPVTALAWAVLLAGIGQLLFQIPFLWRLGMLPRPRWGWREPGVRRILRLMLPTLFGSSVAQINLLFDTLIASFLAAGSVSWLYYSDRLMEFPLGTLAIAMATVILPSLSRRHAASDPERFRLTLDWALRLAVLFGLPAAIGLALLAGPILITLFHSAAFGDHDVAMATASLVAYALGLPAHILIKVLLPGYYARQDTDTPVRIGVIAMVSNMVVNVLLVMALVQLGFSAPHAGLALATSLSACLNAVLLYRGLRRAGVYAPGPGWGVFLSQVTLASAALAALLLWGAGPAEMWVTQATAARAVALSVLIAGGAGVYFSALWLAGFRPASLRALRMA